MYPRELAPSTRQHSKMQFDLIAAVDSNWGIARGGKLPWARDPEGQIDMKWFKKISTRPGTAVIMGRRTWDSLPEKFRPLPNRINVIVSSQYSGVTITHALTETPVVYVGSFTSAIEWCSKSRGVGGSCSVSHCMVIGGKLIYEQALRSAHLRFGFITRFHRDFKCDQKFPLGYLTGVPSELINSGLNYEITRYNFYNRNEQEYLNLLQELTNAPVRPNRTGITSRGVFHRSLRFSLCDPARGMIIPLITTKRINWPAVYHELIWFLRGSTDIDYLSENNIHIWDGNSTREYLDSRGLIGYSTGELGPIYGHQWRNWGGTFVPREQIAAAQGQNVRLDGIDQLSRVIDKIKTDPGDRRLIVSAWNVSQLDEMALPPCHLSFQFHVEFESGRPKYLNCLVNMRSADVALGVPFNIASYSLLTHMVAYLTGLTAAELVISMGDCHLYENHLDGVGEQLTREVRRFPTLQFGPAITTQKPSELTIDHFAKNFGIADYIITNYRPHPSIKLPMAV